MKTATLLTNRDGAAAVEAALVLPILLMVLLGAIEVGRMGWTAIGLNFAVQEAARCAAVQTTVCADAGSTAAYAAGRAAGLNIPASAFTVTRPACGIQVRADLNYSFIASSLAPVTPRISAWACRA
jgi:Flp pilus assembly protein TadG